MEGYEVKTECVEAFKDAFAEHVVGEPHDCNLGLLTVDLTTRWLHNSTVLDIVSRCKAECSASETETGLVL